MAKGSLIYIYYITHHLYTHSSLHLPNVWARFNPRWMLNKEALCWLVLLHYHSAASFGTWAPMSSSTEPVSFKQDRCGRDELITFSESEMEMTKR